MTPSTPSEYLGTSRHANDEPTKPTLRVLACVKCGDRHTVDVSEAGREAVEAYRLAFRAAWENAKRTKGSVMTDVGEVMAVVDRLIEDER